MTLPVEALGLDADICHTLTRLGLKTIGGTWSTIPGARAFGDGSTSWLRINKASMRAGSSP